jgi:hypothetical protein
MRQVRNFVKETKVFVEFFYCRNEKPYKFFDFHWKISNLDQTKKRLKLLTRECNKTETKCRLFANNNPRFMSFLIFPFVLALEFFMWLELLKTECARFWWFFDDGCFGMLLIKCRFHFYGSMGFELLQFLQNGRFYF